MERDFLGLISQGHVSLKEETNDSCSDSGMQWSFSNNNSSFPQLLSFKSTLDGPKKDVYDHVPSTIFPDSLDHNNNPFSTSNWKGSILDNKQDGSHHTIESCPPHHFDIKMPNCTHGNIYPVPPEIISFSMNGPIFQSHYTSTNHNMTGPNVKTQAVVPLNISTPTIPSTSSTFVTADQRKASKPSVSPAQMTIFYAGSVHVYDDLPPEKAKAIMLLAGNGPSPTTHSQAPIPKLSIMDDIFRNPPHASLSVSSLNNATYSTSYTIQPKREFGSMNETESTTPILGTLTPPVRRPETPKMINSLVSTAPTAVPQFRKASLARFLEKRKERSTKAAPYNVYTKSSDCTAISTGDDFEA